LDKIFQKPNISRIESIKNQPIKTPDRLSVLQNNYSHNYTNPLNSANKYLVNFTGLNRTISKTVYKTLDEMKAQVANFPKSMDVVGNLPSEWVNKIPKDARKTTIKALYQNVKTIIKELREKDNIEETTKKLNNAFHEAGVIDENENLLMKKLSSGVFGTGYHIKGIFDDNYMIKMFKSSDSGPWGSERHGNCPEICRAAFWQKNAGKNTQMVRFYFGDIDAGYMVNKYIDKTKTPICNNYVAPEIYGLSSVDADGKEVINGHNKICGYQDDFGGLVISMPELIRNRKAQKGIKKILNAPLDKKAELIKNADSLVLRAVAEYAKSCNNILVKIPATNIENAGKRVKKVSAVAAKYAGETEKVIYLNLLAENSNNKMKRILVDYIKDLPRQKRYTFFDSLAENADNEVKKALAEHLAYFSGPEKTIRFKKLAQNADNSVINALIGHIYCLPVEGPERAVYFKQFVENADNQIKIALADKFDCLPETERAAYFKQFADNADNDIKKALIDNIEYLPEGERVQYFEQWADGADTDLKEALKDKIESLPKSSRAAFSKLLTKNDKVDSLSAKKGTNVKNWLHNVLFGKK